MRFQYGCICRKNFFDKTEMTVYMYHRYNYMETRLKYVIIVNNVVYNYRRKN